MRLTLLKVLLILRARYAGAIVVFVLVVAAGMLASEHLPKRYIAETVVMVDVRSPDPVAALLMPAIMVPGTLGTQLDIVNSDRVARKVVKALKLADDPAVRQMWQSATAGKGRLEDWMSRLLRRGLKVTPSRDSNMLTISYQGGDPVFAAAAANAFTQAYIDASVELKVEPARQYSEWFAEQSKALRESVERAQARLSDFQRRKGIVATEETLDYEHTKLRELAARLLAVQVEIKDADSKQRTGERSAATMPEVMQNSVVQGLRTNINQLEVKLKEARGNLGAKHPQYIRMEAELAELRNRLALETSHAASSYSSSSAVGKAKEAELKAAFDAQTRKILGMKNERDEIAVLVRDVETARKAYDAVTSRLTQTNLESQATRTNISVINSAVVPIAPSFPPTPERTLLIALLVGAVLAVAYALGLELLDQRIRTADDLADMLQVPVLAVIEPSPAAAKLAYRRAAALPSK